MKRRAQPWLGTLVEVCLDDPHGDDGLSAAFEAAFACIALVHRLMSFHDAASDVSRINRASADDVLAVDAHTIRVLQLAEEVRKASGGLFDIACAPLLVASGHLPPPADTVPAFMPDQAIVRPEDELHVRKLAPGWIDLGGIAKGFAVDLAIDAIAGLGIRNACVNAGGDLRVMGEHTWPVVIRAASDPGVPGTSVALRNEALASSATCFSMRIQGESQASALIDTDSGKSLGENIGCSVRAASCVLADALTKVVAATGNTRHPALAAFGASALIM